ncbi:MAG: HAD hydrolase-like protein, partial [Clostridia bacterium]|nr:HAD hydrolase-like protein [Clostridia bacterium]
MRYTDILWDFNGTILSDMEIGIESVNVLLLERGKKPLSGIDEYRAVFGFPIYEYYERIGFDFDAEPYDVVAPLWVAEYMKRMPQSKIFDDVVSVSEAFRGAGLRQTILSASDLDMLRGQLEYFGIS